MRYFVTDYLRLIGEDGEFDAGEALAGVKRTLGYTLADLVDETADADAALKAARGIADGADLTAVVGALKTPKKRVWTASQDAKLEVMVTPK